MPKSSTSRTSKKKKYNARFPPARIKKIMQTDEEVGKVAAAVPVIISRALELFIESLIMETSKTTVAKNAKTLSTSHIKQTIEMNKQFDFLRDLVAGVPDHQTEDNNGDTGTHDGESTNKKGRGRPRKPKELKEGGRNRGASSKASSNTSEDEYDEEDDEDTETDEEGSLTEAGASSSTPSTSSAIPVMGNPQDRLPLPGMSYPGSQRMMDNPLSLQSSLPQHLNNQAVTNVQHQPYQQQYSSSNLPPYSAQPYPLFVPSPSQGMTNYATPPHFLNTYPLMMPSSQHQFQQHLQQIPGSHQQLLNDQQCPTQPCIQQPQSQPQPMNLSYSWATTATTNGNDDYDT